eukprot:CAMPEP_0113500872 /NCGR_PEP_ID=MMETSP0014_2-20120614/32606_1 /TAXON_ID=2857 /ORGANISM="Nitzschia sp." /LENGTH=823 /DNA_ID=CAMNT_0000395329 /DNA_START=1 /DNA_END=2472 /DNA_ORIENTATION=- /assembly_acc=CAM_ASM_000159
MGDNRGTKIKWMDIVEKCLQSFELKTETDTTSGGRKLADPGFFEAKPDAALKTASGVKLRYISRESQPSLLLSNLPIEESNLREEEPLKYIAENTKGGPCTFYGTSGAGKTRRLFEFLSLNYGLYFLASKGRNPGSRDFESSIGRVSRQLDDCIAKSETQDSTEPDCDLNAVLRTSEQNYRKVADIVRLLVNSRIVVFIYVQNILGRRPTPYEWLLLQVSPDKFFDCDAFNVCFVEIAAAVSKRRINEYPEDLETFFEVMHCFIDEAQVLTKLMENKFISFFQTKQHQKCVPRTAYSAYLKGFMNVTAMKGTFRCPLFCGTGLSLHDFVDESSSGSYKPESHVPIFYSFEFFSEEKVMSYMKEMVDLDGIGADLILHAAKWLRGRPRATAFFIETFLEQKDKTDGFVASKGRFANKEGPFIRSIDRYVDILTSEEGSNTIGSSSNRLSWSARGSGAYHTVKSLLQKGLTDQSQCDARQDLIRSACAFALSGKSQIVSDKSAQLIQLGIASTVVDVTMPGFIKCCIDEPLIIQACINRLSFGQVVVQEMISSTNDVEKGLAFENFLRPQLQSQWKNVLAEELPDYQADLACYDVPTLSSYGVLSKVCETPSATLCWLKDASSARFEGTVEPFCKPDALMGPDLLSLLRDKNFTSRLLAVQTKLRYKVNQLEALRTIQPAMFYIADRSSKDPKLNKQLKNEDAEMWLELQNCFLFPRQDEAPPNKVAKIGDDDTPRPRTQPIVRMLVQFPAKKSRNSASGLVKFTEVNVTEDTTKQNCGMNDDDLDALIVIDRNSAHSLFGVEEQALLKLLKQIDTEECPVTFDV